MMTARSLEEAEVQIESLHTRVLALEQMVATLNREVDMSFRTPYWKRLLFRIDGWPLHRVITEKELPNRPWRRWWRS